MYKLGNYSELPVTSGIYLITNIINQKYYLGRALNFKERLYIHLYNLSSKSHHNIHLQRAFKKYGIEYFEIKIIEYPNISLEELIEIEQRLLDIHVGLPLCYNISKFATGGSESGENHPNYGKIRINNGIEEMFINPWEEIPKGYTNSSKNKGKCWINNGYKEEFFLADNQIPDGFSLGRLPESAETKQKKSKALIGKIKINNGIKERYIPQGDEIPDGFCLGGKPLSNKTKEKQSIALSGDKNPLYKKKCYNNGIKQEYFSADSIIPEGFIIGGLSKSAEFKQKRLGEKNPMFGQTHSEETRKKQSEAKKIRVITSSCCYFSIKDAYKELGISQYKFYKLFEKDSITGFYVEVKYIREKD